MSYYLSKIIYDSNLIHQNNGLDSALILFKQKSERVSQERKKLLSAKLLSQSLIVYAVNKGNQTGFLVYSNTSGRLSWLLDDEFYDSFKEILNIKMMPNLDSIEICKKIEMPNTGFGRMGLKAVANKKEIPSCINCQYCLWMVAIGQGIQCKHEDNKIDGKLYKISNRNYCCEFFEWQDE